MNLTEKKNKTLKALKDYELDRVFQITNETEEFILFQSEQNGANGKYIISLQLDDRPFNGIYYYIAKLNNLGKKENMLELLNSFNEENLLLKFFLNEDNVIMAQAMYIATDDNFNAHEYISLVSPAFRTIEDNFYSKIMRVIWG